MADAPKRTRLKENTGSSRRLNEQLKAIEKGGASPQPKLRKRESAPAIGSEQKVLLKKAFDDLCCPQRDSADRVAKWVQLHARKDDKLEAWLKTQCELFPNLARFKPSQFLKCLEGQKLEKPRAELYTNALFVSQSAFSSTASYLAAQEVVKAISKGDTRSRRELVEDLMALNRNVVSEENLQQALTDVGIRSRIIRGLLNAALDIQDPDHDDSYLEQAADNLHQILERLSGNPSASGSITRLSAPVGTIRPEAVKKQRKEIPALSFPEQNLKGENAPTQTTPKSPGRLAVIPTERSKSSADSSDSKLAQQESSSDSRHEEKHIRRSATQRKKKRERSKEGGKEGGKDRSPAGTGAASSVSTTTTTSSTMTTTTTAVTPRADSPRGQAPQRTLPDPQQKKMEPQEKKVVIQEPLSRSSSDPVEEGSKSPRGTAGDKKPKPYQRNQPLGGAALISGLEDKFKKKTENS